MQLKSNVMCQTLYGQTSLPGLILFICLACVIQVSIMGRCFQLKPFVCYTNNRFDGLECILYYR